METSMCKFIFYVKTTKTFIQNHSVLTLFKLTDMASIKVRLEIMGCIFLAF